MLSWTTYWVCGERCQVSTLWTKLAATPCNQGPWESCVITVNGVTHTHFRCFRKWKHLALADWKQIIFQDCILASSRHDTPKTLSTLHAFDSDWYHITFQERWATSSGGWAPLYPFFFKYTHLQNMQTHIYNKACSWSLGYANTPLRLAKVPLHTCMCMTQVTINDILDCYSWHRQSNSMRQNALLLS